MMKRFLALALGALLLQAALPAFAQGNLVQVAEQDIQNRFTTLLAAVDAAGLTSTLETDQLTLFAPTNGAFATLLRELEMTEGELLNDDELLEDVLLYHLVPGRITFADLEELAGQRNDGVVVVQTVAGSNLRLAVDANRDEAVINFGAASVVEADIDASNGVIHAINNVLLPEDAEGINELESSEIVMDDDADPDATLEPGATEEASEVNIVPEEIIVDVETTSGNLADIIALTDDLSILAEAVEAADLVTVLEDPNVDEEEDDQGFTMFAPTDQAFRNLLSFTGLTESELLESDVLEDILRYHVSEGVKPSEEFADLERPIETIIEGGAIDVRVTSSGGVELNNIFNIIQADIPADNGVMHVIDGVLLPGSAIEAFGL